MQGWLQGFFDGEGGVYFYWHKPRRQEGRTLQVGRVSAANTAQELITRCSTYLTAFEIRHTIRTIKLKNPKYRVVYNIDIASAEGIAGFAEHVGFTEDRKSQRLAEIITYHREQRRRRPQWDSQKLAEAIDMYNNGQSCNQIAPHFGFAHGESIRRHFAALGIKMRTKAEAITLRERNAKGQIISSVHD